MIGEPVKWGAIISLHLLVLPQFDLYDPAPRPLVTLVLSGSTSMFLKSSGDLSFDHEVIFFILFDHPEAKTNKLKLNFQNQY